MAKEAAAGAVDYGVATRARDGETVTGDRHIIRARGAAIVLAVIDGLGHGAEAARAADLAARVVASHRSTDIVELTAACHEQLRRSRGVVMTLMSISPAARLVTALGVGNVQGMIVHPGGTRGEPERDFILLRGGVVGHLLPGLRPSVMQVTRGDLFVLATDGIGIEFTTEERLNEPPQELADRILSRHATRTDDALVLVARYIGD